MPAEPLSPEEFERGFGASLINPEAFARLRATVEALAEVRGYLDEERTVAKQLRARAEAAEQRVRELEIQLASMHGLHFSAVEAGRRVVALEADLADFERSYNLNLDMCAADRDAADLALDTERNAHANTYAALEASRMLREAAQTECDILQRRGDRLEAERDADANLGTALAAESALATEKAALAATRERLAHDTEQWLGCIKERDEATMACAAMRARLTDNPWHDARCRSQATTLSDTVPPCDCSLSRLLSASSPGAGWMSPEQVREVALKVAVRVRGAVRASASVSTWDGWHDTSPMVEFVDVYIEAIVKEVLRG